MFFMSSVQEFIKAENRTESSYGVYMGGGGGV